MSDFLVERGVRRREKKERRGDPPPSTLFSLLLRLLPSLSSSAPRGELGVQPLEEPVVPLVLPLGLEERGVGRSRRGGGGDRVGRRGGRGGGGGGFGGGRGGLCRGGGRGGLCYCFLFFQSRGGKKKMMTVS